MVCGPWPMGMPLEGGGDRGWVEFVRGGRTHAGKQGEWGDGWWCEQAEGGGRGADAGRGPRWDGRSIAAAVRIRN